MTTGRPAETVRLGTDLANTLEEAIWHVDFKPTNEDEAAREDAWFKAAQALIVQWRQHYDGAMTRENQLAE